MKIVLLNLARFGDLLQGQAAIRDLAAQGHEVALVCLENFSAAAGLLSDVARLFVFPGAELLSFVESGADQAPAGAGERRWHKALASLGRWKADLMADFAPDAVCNLTPAVAPRMLARYLAGSRPCSGFYMDDFGFGVDGNAWAAYLKGAAAVRGVSPFNIVDMFRKSALFSARPAPGRGKACLTIPDELLRGLARQKLLEAAPAQTRGFVALQLGASEERRQWPVDYFARLGDALWHAEKLCPVLLGSKAESGLAEGYASLAGAPFVNMCGRTGLDDLAALLCQCRLLVSNDTGTMHLAAGLDVPVLAIFLATAQPFDTGPYREDCLCLEPDLPCHPCAFGVACPHKQACRERIDPDFVSSMALGYLRQGQWPLPDGAAPARAWRSRLDAQGLMDLEPLSGHGLDERSAWFCLLRRHMLPYLEADGALAATQAGAHAPESPLSCPVMPPQLALDLAGKLKTARQLMLLLLQQGRVVLEKPVPMMRERFLTTWEKVRLQLHSEAYFSSLALLWTQSTQEAGHDLAVSLREVERFERLLLSFEETLQQNAACAELRPG